MRVGHSREQIGASGLIKIQVDLLVICKVYSKDAISIDRQIQLESRNVLRELANLVARERISRISTQSRAAQIGELGTGHCHGHCFVYLTPSHSIYRCCNEARFGDSIVRILKA